MPRFLALSCRIRHWSCRVLFETALPIHFPPRQQLSHNFRKAAPIQQLNPSTTNKMMFNKKMLVVLAVAMLSFASASPGSLRKLQDDKKDPEGSGITLKHFKGKDNTDPDELDLDLKIKTCKKGDECAALLGADEDAEEVSLATFTSMMADDMVDALESDDDEDDRRELERDLGYRCYYRTYYYCTCCSCYYRTRYVCFKY